MARNPWERMPGESAAAYAAALMYFELGADRSQNAVGNKVGKTRQHVSRLAMKYEWSERARAWDTHCLKLKLDADIAAMKAAAAARAKKWAAREDEFDEDLWASFKSAVRRLKRADREDSAADDQPAERPAVVDYSRILRDVIDSRCMGAEALAPHRPTAAESEPFAAPATPEAGEVLTPPPGMSADHAALALRAIAQATGGGGPAE